MYLSQRRSHGPLVQADLMDIVVPVYNEHSRDPSGFEGRLHYFSGLAERWKTVVVDDGSEDGTFTRAERFAAQRGRRLKVVALNENGRKVGALKRGLEECPAPLILQMDFDVTVDVGAVEAKCRDLLAQDDAGAYGFRLSTRGRSILGGFQDLEYALEAVAREERFRAEGTISFAQGPCVLWKREVLSMAIGAHSGRRDAEDEELSGLALRAGYRTLYDPGVVVETAAAEGPRELVLQRVRWYARTKIRINRGVEAAGPARLAGDTRTLLKHPGYLADRRDLALLPAFPFYRLSLLAIAVMGRRFRGGTR